MDDERKVVKFFFANSSFSSVVKYLCTQSLVHVQKNKSKARYEVFGHSFRTECLPAVFSRVLKYFRTSVIIRLSEPSVRKPRSLRKVEVTL